VGKSILAFHRDEEELPSSKCFGFVQTLDEKPKRRLFEGLKAPGLQMNQPLTFPSDGGDTVRDLRDAVVQELEWLKWFVWHRNVYGALQEVEAAEMDLDVAAALGDPIARTLLNTVADFHTYIERNYGFIPNDGERYRDGERIRTGFVEPTVNQVISKRFCKHQQMQWTKREHISYDKPEENLASGTRGGVPVLVSGSAGGGGATGSLIPSCSMLSAGVCGIHHRDHQGELSKGAVRMSV
jgi:hypothetical protein